MTNYIIIVVFILIIFILYNKKPEKIVKNIFKIANIKISDKQTDDPLTITVINKKFYKEVLLKGELGFAETYMDGYWTCSDLETLLYELLINHTKIEQLLKSQSITLSISLIIQYINNLFHNNTLNKSIKNVEHHYDIGNDLYQKMLGKTMVYTCGYFYKPNITLDEAQIAKIDMVAKKLHLKEGMCVLDIGCGFGSAAYYIGTKYKVNVLGVTLSKEQLKCANDNYKSKYTNYKYQDYRHVTGKFDRVYSIGMFEHIGLKNYPTYFNKCYELLKDDGIMLLHTIGSNYLYSGQSTFINKYIFPGGQLPRKKDIIGNFLENKWGLEDWHNFGISYRHTLNSWHNNIKDWKGLDNYNERFRKMWKFYLLSCAANFKAENICLWQIVFTKLKHKKPDIYNRISLN